MKIMSYVLSAALLVAVTGMPASALVANWDFNADGADSTGGTVAGIENGTTTFGTDGTKGFNHTIGSGHWNMKSGLPTGLFNSSDGNSFSASVWVKMDSLPASGESFLIGKTAFGGGTGWALTFQNNGGNMRLNYYLGGIDGYQPTTLGNDGLGVWHHIGIIYDGAAQKMRTYHDGSLLDVSGSGNHNGNSSSLHVNGNANAAKVGVSMDHARYEDSNIGDVGMLAAWNSGVNPAPIPEPATLGLLAAGGLLMLRRRSA